MLKCFLLHLTLPSMFFLSINAFSFQDVGIHNFPEVAISVEPLKVQNWILPEMPGLITDFQISLDDQFPYFVNWLHGDIRQYNIEDPKNPVLKGQVRVEGLLWKGSSIVAIVEDGNTWQSEVPEVQHLYASFEEEIGVFQYATAITSNDIEKIQKFLDKTVGSSCERLIIKTLDEDSIYEPSNRSNNWLKLKKDYLDKGLARFGTIAAFHGCGNHTGVYGAFLLACYDYNNEEFQSICKIGTGFTEDVLEPRSKSLGSQVIPEPKLYYRYGDTMKPDVWLEASEV
ncbi:DNA ligase [Arachis hypogaea]|nr:DNA ligase [Arachis hypogaea]